MNNAIFTTEKETRNGLFIMKSSTDGSYVRAYENDPSEGYIVLLQRRFKTIPMFGSTKITQSVRQCLYSGPIAVLNEIINMWSESGKVPGQIVSVDRLYSELPESVRNSKNLNKNAKTAGKDGVPLTLGGEQIYQTRYYTEDMDVHDVRIQHDNTEAVQQQVRERRELAKQAAAAPAETDNVQL